MYQKYICHKCVLPRIYVEYRINVENKFNQQYLGLFQVTHIIYFLIRKYSMNNLCFYFIERSNDRINIENYFIIIANVYNWHRDSYYWNWVRLRHCLGWGWLFCPSSSIGIDKKWRAAPHWRFIFFGGYTRFLVFICPPIWYDCSMSTNICRVITLKKLCTTII